MAFNAKDVAEWLLTEAKHQGLSMTHMKLQKLLYYAQAYTLGMTGQPLFNNQIQAWQHGPVVPDVYSVYNRYGRDVIDNFTENNAPDDFYVLIVTIVRDKGHLSDNDLQDMTHNEATWQQAWNSPEPKIISNNMIEKSFTPLFWTSDEEDDDDDEIWMSAGEKVTPEELEAILQKI